MILRIINNDFHYEGENVCRIFFPNEKIVTVYDLQGEDSKEVCIESESKENGTIMTVTCNISGEFRKSSKEVPDNGGNHKNDCELAAAELIYKELSDITGYISPWGIVTGVRPSKLLMRLMEEMGDENGRKYFQNELMVCKEKADLTESVARTEKRIIELSRPDSFSLYISIPFCPSRCSYCSFVSHAIANPNAKRLLPEYVEYLIKEIVHTGKIATDLGLRLESIYFGGGTPGVLDAAQFDMIQCAIESNYDLSNLREYNVEIGRPDTVTADKLGILKLHNVDRISINPQTFKQSTLDLVGREHTVEQAVNAFRLAKSYNFKTINMDFIAGLPEETVEDYKDSIDTAVSLNPENITIHSLSLKRSSNLGMEGAQVKEGIEAQKMLEYSSEKLFNAGYSPYYMYRQSKCVGNLENVGWSKTGHEGVYNIFMMEECHTVLACGAGAVIKLCEPGGVNVERIFNYKYPFEYNSGFDTIIDRKDQIYDFYTRYKIGG